jgi:hypothetical protein
MMYITQYPPRCLLNQIAFHPSILYIETTRPNTNRYVHAHKCLHCVESEPATSYVVGEYSHHYAKSESHYNLVLFSPRFGRGTVYAFVFCPNCSNAHHAKQGV